MTGALHRRLSRIERRQPGKSALDALFEHIAKHGGRIGDPDPSPVPEGEYPPLPDDPEKHCEALEAMFAWLAAMPAEALPEMLPALPCAVLDDGAQGEG